MQTDWLKHAGMSVVGNMAKLRPRRLILLYHSLCSTAGNDTQQEGYRSRKRSVLVESFEAQLQWLSTFADFVTLDDIMRPRADLDRWQVAITFDDGYLDNITLGLPVLEKYRVPMTWFVCTRFVEDRAVLPWWDLVDYIAERVQQPIQLEIDGTLQALNLTRSAALREFKQLFRRVGGAEQKVIHRQLKRVAEAEGPLPSNAFAGREEISEAAQSPWIRLGGHTVTHLNMAMYDEERLHQEVQDGREVLQYWTGQSVDWFAYPYGQREYWNERARCVVEDAGFSGAVTADPAYADHTTDRYTVPRLTVFSHSRLRMMIGVMAPKAYERM